MSDANSYHMTPDEFRRRGNSSGDLYLTHAVLDGTYTLRLSVGQTHTEAQQVARAWQRIREVAAELEL